MNFIQPGSLINLKECQKMSHYLLEKRTFEIEDFLNRQDLKNNKSIH